MKKTFEFFLVLIIFYGVYSAFDSAAPVLFENPNGFWVIIVSLVVAALILVLYSFIISSEVQLKMKKNIDELKSEIKQKEQEVKKAKSFKEDLIAKAEQSKKIDYKPISQIEGCKNTLTKTEMNGVSMVSISGQIDATAYDPVKEINATWVSIIPFGFIRSGESNVQYNLSWQWHGEKLEGTIESIALAKAQGLKVFLKPHLWVHNVWVGDLEFTNETDWQTFESTYYDYIMEFAEVADSMGVEAYCVGVELKKTVVPRAAFWNRLIDSVKTVYSGKLTYAANWDNYEIVPFWNKLDYIGIDSYFPLSDSQTPSFEECYAGWKDDYLKIKAKSETENKKVIFTEYGFRNVDYTGKEPWKSDRSMNVVNLEAQTNTTLALFETFWNEDWFAGGFLWKWHHNYGKAGGENNSRFTPQNKPAEVLIKEMYSKYSYF